MKKVKNERQLANTHKAPGVRASVPVVFLQLILYTDRGTYTGPRIIERRPSPVGVQLVTEKMTAYYDFEIQNVYCLDPLNREKVRVENLESSVEVTEGEEIVFGFHFKEMTRG